MLSVSLDPRRWCQSLVPQLPQKAQSSVLPVSVGRDQNLGFPWVRRNAACGTMKDIPNAEADCLRHSTQWQTNSCNGPADNS
jgi:hypothetical protein